MTTTFYKEDYTFETPLGDRSVIIDLPPRVDEGQSGLTQLYATLLGSYIGVLVADYCDEIDLDARDMTVEVVRRTLNCFKVTVNLPNADCKSYEEAIRRVVNLALADEMLATGVDLTIRDRDDLSQLMEAPPTHLLVT